MSERVKQWPNGIGWDVGQAEVRDCGNRLRVFVPVGKGHHKVLDVPLGRDPVLAVSECRAYGAVRPNETPFRGSDVPIPFYDGREADMLVAQFLLEGSDGE